MQGLHRLKMDSPEGQVRVYPGLAQAWALELLRVVLLPGDPGAVGAYGSHRCCVPGAMRARKTVAPPSSCGAARTAAEFSRTLRTRAGCL
jgi:hypothetical protein